MPYANFHHFLVQQLQPKPLDLGSKKSDLLTQTFAYRGRKWPVTEEPQ